MVKGLQRLIRSVVLNEYTEVSYYICIVLYALALILVYVPPIPGLGLLPNPPVDPPIRRITLTSRTHRSIKSSLTQTNYLYLSPSCAHQNLVRTFMYLIKFF